LPDRAGSQTSAGAGGEERPIRIAVDAMGSDNAPNVEVEGGVAAAREAEGRVEVVLVGRKDVVEAELARHDCAGLPISIVDAPEAIQMSDAPASAIRRKRGASIVVATKLHRSGEIDGLVSAGNTGAVVASTLLGLGMLPSVRRPAIASMFPTMKQPAVVLDVGASIDSRPSDLLVFAAMGDVFAHHVLGRERPRVALMNIGEEPTKGSQLTQQAYSLISQSSLNFIGNVEGKGFLRGEADVVVCDGFVGNIMLKLVEGVKDILVSRFGGEGASPGLDALASQFDYAEYGGAPLLGVNGVVIIAHGSSSSKAIKNAIKVAAKFVRIDLDARIVDRVTEAATTNGG
jgi:glycerol-3-phosphate acyltransferase PlsX